MAASRARRPPPAWLESLRGAATVYLTVTFVVVIALLKNVDVGLQLKWVDITLHEVTPLVIVADWGAGSAIGPASPGERPCRGSRFHSSGSPTP